MLRAITNSSITINGSKLIGILRGDTILTNTTNIRIMRSINKNYVRIPRKSTLNRCAQICIVLNNRVRLFIYNGMLESISVYSRGYSQYCSFKKSRIYRSGEYTRNLYHRFLQLRLRRLHRKYARSGSISKTALLQQLIVGDTTRHDHVFGLQYKQQLIHSGTTLQYRFADMLENVSYTFTSNLSRQFIIAIRPGIISGIKMLLYAFGVGKFGLVTFCGMVDRFVDIVVYANNKRIRSNPLKIMNFIYKTSGVLDNLRNFKLIKGTGINYTKLCSTLLNPYTKQITKNTISGFFKYLDNVRNMFNMYGRLTFRVRGRSLFIAMHLAKKCVFTLSPGMFYGDLYAFHLPKQEKADNLKYRRGLKRKDRKQFNRKNKVHR